MTGPIDEGRRARWRDAAAEIAWALTDVAVWTDGICAFHGATSPEAVGAPPRFRSFGGDLYEGSAGIARFLGLAADVLDEPRFRETALGAVHHAMEAGEGWSLFGGEMGIGLVGLELAERLEETGLVVPAVRAVERASALALAEGGAYDFLLGQAGVVVGLSTALEYDLDGGWRERALALASALLEIGSAEGAGSAQDPAMSWPMTAGSSERLCGIAHGASGFALAFEEVQALAPSDPCWSAAARAARAFERAHYSAEVGSWADLRALQPGELDAGAPTYPHMWCHGSIGVTAERIAASGRDVLAHADALGGLAGARMHAELLLAGPVGAAGGDGVNGSLCHGLAGLIDLFADAWIVSDDETWLTLAADVADHMLNDRRRPGGWRSGVPGGWSAPGLMLGNAGMGWALLRAADPAGVPSGWRPGPRPTRALG